ncbi:MAG: NADH-quinone oxidoreductase subunit J [Pyrodictiaceae archaeon]
MMELDLFVALIALATGLASAIGIVVVRRSFYAIIWLAFVGVATAMAMVVMGFTYLAIFHLLIYVGATIAFLTLVMTAIGEQEEAKPKHSLSAAIVAAIAAVAVTTPAAIMASSPGPYSLSQVIGHRSDLALWVEVSRRVFVDLWPATVFALIALVAMLVEVVAVARKS